MNYFSFGSYKYRYVFETAKLTKNLYLADMCPEKMGIVLPIWEFDCLFNLCPDPVAAAGGIILHNSPFAE